MTGDEESEGLEFIDPEAEKRARLAEAAKDSIGVETPLTMNLAIKTFTLLIVAGLTVLISGYSLG